MRVTVGDLSRKVNYLSQVILDRKIITEFTRCISYTRIVENVSKNRQIFLQISPAQKEALTIRLHSAT